MNGDVITPKRYDNVDVALVDAAVIAAVCAAAVLGELRAKRGDDEEEEEEEEDEEEEEEDDESEGAVDGENIDEM